MSDNLLFGDLHRSSSRVSDPQRAKPHSRVPGRAAIAMDRERDLVYHWIAGTFAL